MCSDAHSITLILCVLYNFYFMCLADLGLKDSAKILLIEIVCKSYH